MPYDPEKHDRRSIRLPSYDYGQPGAYFVTVCTHDRACLFGDVIDGCMALNAHGRIARDEWRRTERLRDNVALDAFVVMPNHVHGIVVITGDADGSGDTDGGGSTRRRDTARRVPTTGTGRRFGQPRPGTLPTIVGAFKSAATRRIQRYIRQNPARWRRDRNHSKRG